MPVHHMVVLKFKPTSASDTPDRLFTALANLKKTIPNILHYSGGPYASPEGLHQGFTHGFLMTFPSAAAHNHYLDHPDHEKVKNEFLPTIENIVVFDFEEK